MNGPWGSSPGPLPLSVLDRLSSLLAVPDAVGLGPPPLDLVGVHVHRTCVSQPAEPALLLGDGLVGTDEVTILAAGQRNTRFPIGLKGGKPSAWNGPTSTPWQARIVRKVYKARVPSNHN